jgi:DNA polymerase I
VSTSPATIYLIDGSAYIYRAYHAVRGLTSSKGQATNAVYGFTRMLIKLMEDRQPEYVGMFFDTKGPTFRHEIYADYKANRPPMPDDLVSQLPYIKQITKGFNIPIVERQGFEADDLIGSFARLAEGAGFKVVMVTGDKDFKQLVTAKTQIWDPMKDQVIDVSAIREEMGIEPPQVIDMLGLAGDTSDNVPGVPGIGPKTALTLIKQFGGMEAIYDRIEEISRPKQREKLAAFREQAFLSKRLVTIDTGVAIDFDPEALRLKPSDQEALEALYAELEFRQLQQRTESRKPKNEKNYQAVMDTEALEALVNRLKKAPFFALDTETTSVNPMQARLVGVSLALAPHEAFYIPCGHRYLGAPDQLTCDTVLSILAPVFEDPAITKIGQNIKYDWIVLERHGARLAGVGFDTMLASYLLDPGKRAHNLDRIALDYLGHQTITYEDVAGKGKKAVGFDQILVEKAVPYACEDADITLLARDCLMPKLTEAGVEKLFADVEMPLVPVLKRMEMTGMCVDRSRLRILSEDFAAQMETLEEEIYKIAGERFNVKSSQQLGHILFEKLNLPVVKKTRKKTGYSTDVDVLTQLAAKHELPALILRHRSLAKLKSTYADALLELIHPETGRIHTSFNQTVAATGRLSSSDPNLQNIPIRTAEGRQIREAFVPRSGWKLVSADYSQIELRLLAHVSGDPILSQSFRDGEDIHARTAAEVFQALPGFVDPELRRQAKAINFGIIYGMSAYGLSKNLDISQKMAQTYIDNYFARYRGVQTYMQATIAAARESGRTSTLLGRIRPLPDIHSKNHNLRQFAERMAINTPIQGTAADLIKLAMIRMDKALDRAGLQAAMLLSVHDEIVFEAPPEELAELEALATKVMEGVWELQVPLKVNIDSGDNWAEAH